MRLLQHFANFSFCNGCTTKPILFFVPAVFGNRHNKDCVYVDEDGNWNAYYCYRNKTSICELGMYYTQYSVNSLNLFWHCKYFCKAWTSLKFSNCKPEASFINIWFTFISIMSKSKVPEKGASAAKLLYRLVLVYS